MAAATPNSAWCMRAGPGRSALPEAPLLQSPGPPSASTSSRAPPAKAYMPMTRARTATLRSSPKQSQPPGRPHAPGVHRIVVTVVLVRRFRAVPERGQDDALTMKLSEQHLQCHCHRGPQRTCQGAAAYALPPSQPSGPLLRPQCCTQRPQQSSLSLQRCPAIGRWNRALLVPLSPTERLWP